MAHIAALFLNKDKLWTTSPVRKSKIRIEPSEYPTADFLPSGRITAVSTGSPCPWNILLWPPEKKNVINNQKLAKSPFGLYKFSPILPKLLLTNPHREDRRISMTIFEIDVVKSLTQSIKNLCLLWLKKYITKIMHFL